MRHGLSIVCGMGLLSAVSLGALKPGDKAPDFGLKATDGKTYSSKEALGKQQALMVVFIATKCPYSNAYNERYNALAAELRTKWNDKVGFFAINPNDTEPLDQVAEHAREKKFTFPVLKDEAHKVADSFGAERTPEAYLIGKDGKVLYHGRIDDDTEGKNIKRRDLMAAAGEYLSGSPVSVKETKALGCTIKRK